MKKQLNYLLILFCTLLSGYAIAQPCTTMYVKGRNLYTAAGEKVVLRGVNEMFVYANADIRGTSTLPQIAMTGANAVRIVWRTNGAAADLDALLGNCIANKMIPMVQLDDITGNLGGLQTCLNYWKRTDIITVLTKYKKWVLLNIANEAGDNNVTDAQYKTAYIDAISQLRGVGYTMPLVIDAAGYGQQESFIINNWAALLQADSQKNCLFSLHPYWKDTAANIQSRFTALVTSVVNNNIPFILGEGPQQKGWDCTTTIPYSWIMQQCQTNGIGWLVWTWGKVQDGTGGCANNFDVTTNGNYGSWSNTWGSDIAINDLNSIKKTSIRPASLLGTIDTTAPLAASSLGASAITANGVTLTWVASTDNFGVASYDIYRGTALLGNSTTNSITLASLACNTAYTSVTVKAKDCAGNVSVASNAVSFTTITCDTQAPSKVLNLTASNTSTTSTSLTWAASTDNIGVTSYSIYNLAGTLLGTSASTNFSITGLVCGTTQGFYVIAKDAAGNLSVASSSVSVTTMACPAGEVVYADALAINWSESAWSWGGTVSNFSNTSPKFEGNNSIKVDYAGWSGFSVRRTSAIVPTSNTVIKFSVYSTGANQLNIYTQTDDSGLQSSSVYVTTVANQWTNVTLSMSALGNPTAIKRINIQNNTANASTVYLDYIRFDINTTSIDTQAPSTPSNLVASGTSQTSTNLSWAASTDNVGVTSYCIYNSAGTLLGTSTTTNFAVTNLACGTSYGFYVKAKDAAGNLSAQSNTVSTSTNTCMPEIVVYDESLNTGWEEATTTGTHWSWGYMGMDFNNSWAKVGTKSIWFQYYAWGGLVLRKTLAAHSTTANTILKFWAYTNNATSIQVYTTSTDTGNASASPFIVALPVGQWTEYSIPMGQLGNPSQIKRIIFQNYNANNAIIYYDNIRLVNVTGARIGLEEPQANTAIVAFPNPSSGLINLSYFTEKAEKVSIEVVNIRGIVIKQQEEQALTGQNTFSMDMKAADEGTYFIRMTGELTNKIVKVSILK